MGVMYGTLADSRSCSAMSEMDMNRRPSALGIGDQMRTARLVGVSALYSPRTEEDVMST